jgi:hypothetical protein
VETQTVRIATTQDSEEAVLCSVDGVIYAVLVVLTRPDGSQAWYLHAGFGPCEQEGLIFETLADAARWVDERIASGRRR